MNVVVGYDGSDFAMQALDWAMDEAELGKGTLTVCHAWRWPYGEADEEAKGHLRKAAEHVLWHGADCARHVSTIAEVDTDLYQGPAARRLVELSASADLVVAGSRGLGRLPATVLGSVATEVAENARCPVVVVRGAGPLPSPSNPGPVVAAITPDMWSAVMDFACHEAELRRLPVLAVDVSGPSAYGYALVTPPFLTPAWGEDVDEWRARFLGVEVTVRAGHGIPRKALLDASREATLLVIGRSRPGHLDHLAQAMLRESHCPVAVVPAGDDLRR
ncbi:universal stress protein [Thermoactinospora rubra]|uniref:universal stress protein n=1 Tax=Thermoactinospora rubra TaxID=1088767 RepID=UPI000A0FBFF2|nr:universal stress protein [Thermoactinospora rubra]